MDNEREYYKQELWMNGITLEHKAKWSTKLTVIQTFSLLTLPRWVSPFSNLMSPPHALAPVSIFPLEVSNHTQTMNTNLFPIVCFISFPHQWMTSVFISSLWTSIGPYGDRTRDLGVISTTLWPTELTGHFTCDLIWLSAQKVREIDRLNASVSTVSIGVKTHQTAGSFLPVMG